MVKKDVFSNIIGDKRLGCWFENKKSGIEAEEGASIGGISNRFHAETVCVIEK
jgi:hypothetical protein